MRLWRVVVLVDLALVLGVAGGYLWWGRQAARLAREVDVLRAAQAAGAEREYHADGVVRAVLPELNVVVITHGEIPGYMPAMTMGFRATSPSVYEGMHAGDSVTFVLRGVPPNMAVVGMQRRGP